MEVISKKKLKIAIFFGGPSTEKNISLDSARTFYDSVRLSLLEKNISLIFVSETLDFYKIPNAWIYGNTIEDYSDLLEIPDSSTSQSDLGKNKKFIASSFTHKPHLRRKIPKPSPPSANKTPPMPANTNTALQQSALTSFEDLAFTGVNKQHLLPRLDDQQLEYIISSSDVLIPLIHGQFGEDGELIKLFTICGRSAYIGSDAETLALSMNKHLCQQRISMMGMQTAKNIYYDKPSSVQQVARDARTILGVNESELFFVKPNDGGSSDGVQQTDLSQLAFALKTARRFSKNILLEKKVHGKEFSLIVLEDAQRRCQPLLPSEIEVMANEGESLERVFYTRKRKYLPGSGVHHLTPARFSKAIVKEIRQQAAQLFVGFRFRHWARFDGFLKDDSTVVWGELNAIPGMGQDGFLFQQGALAGLPARAIVELLLEHALNREGKKLEQSKTLNSKAGKATAETTVITPKAEMACNDKTDKSIVATSPLPIAVLGGGESSERQVSRMSWHNVCLKLENSGSDLIYLFMDKQKNIWEVPRFVALLHTVEEIDAAIAKGKKWHTSLESSAKAMADFALPSGFKETKLFAPRCISWPQLRKKCAYVFIALHGGIGENGELQKQLKDNAFHFNGSGVQASALCANKVQTNAFLTQTNIKGFNSLPNRIFTLERWKKSLSKMPLKERVQLQNELQRHGIKKTVSHIHFKKLMAIVVDFLNKILEGSGMSYRDTVLKPANEGCSTGVLVLPFTMQSQDRLARLSYFMLMLTTKQTSVLLSEIDPLCDDKEQRLLLPEDKSPKAQLMLEKQIDVGDPNVLEMTVGVMQREVKSRPQRKVALKGKANTTMANDASRKSLKWIPLLPSQTVSLRSALSLEEKFNKGIGANLTPPRNLEATAITSIRRRIATFAQALNLEDYARIDVFYNVASDELTLIEVNTLPGLTAATVLYSQALLTAQVRLAPADFLKAIVCLKTKC